MNALISGLIISLAAACLACKPKSKSDTKAAENAVLIDSLLEVSRIEADYLLSGRPLFDTEEEVAQSKMQQTAAPGGCDPAQWSLDPRWNSKAFTELAVFQNSGDIRVALAAERVAIVLAGKLRLTCAKEFITARLRHIVSTRQNICNDFVNCGIAVDLLEAGVQYAADSAAVAESIKNVEDLSSCLKESSEHGIRSSAIIAFRLRSVKLHAQFYSMTDIYSPELEGKAIKVSDEDYKSFLAKSNELKVFAFNELFVVNQWGKTLPINPEYIQDEIISDMLGSVEAFTKLDENLQTMVITEAMGFYEAAWQLQSKNIALQMYAERLVGENARSPDAWLEKVSKAVSVWHTEEKAFSFQPQPAASQNASASFDASSIDWAASISPHIALEALTMFTDREAKLPSRGRWGQTLSRIYEMIPATDQSAEVKMKYVSGRQAMQGFRTTIKNALQNAGVLQKKQTSTEDKPGDSLAKRRPKAKEEPSSTDESVLATLNALLDGEDDIAKKFDDFDSAYREIFGLNLKLLVRQNTATRIVKRMSNGAEPDPKEKEALITELDTASIDVLGQWLRIECLQRLGAPRADGGTTLDKVPFFLDTSIKINFPCKDPNASAPARNLQALDTRIAGYTSSITFAKGWDRAAAKLKETAALGVMLVAGMPAGLAGAAAAKVTMALLERVAVSTATSFLKKKFIQSVIISSVDLFVNFQVFGAIMTGADLVMSQVVGATHERSSGTWAQFFYHQAHGLIVFAGFRHVDRFASLVAKRIPGLAGASKSKELSKLLQDANGVLKQNWKQRTADFGVRLASDTTYFYATGEIGEFVGQDVFKIFGEMSPEQKAFQKLYAKSHGQKVADSFSMALAFRTMGLAHSHKAMPSNAQFESRVESVRHELTGKMTREMAFRVLELPPNASAESVSSAKRKLSRKNHPDTYIPTLIGRFKEALPGLTPAHEKVINEGIRNGDKFRDIISKIDASGIASPQVSKAIGTEYSNCVALYKQLKLVTQAADLISKGK